MQKTVFINNRFDPGNLHYTLRDGGERFADDEMSVILLDNSKQILLHGGETKINSGNTKHTRIV